MITDAPQHVTGDGIVAGIWKPYKHECSLVDVRQLFSWNLHHFITFQSPTSNAPKKKIYRSLENDYPSISEVNYWLEKKQTTLIIGLNETIMPQIYWYLLGTTERVFPLYQQMVDEQVLYRAVVGKIGSGGEIKPEPGHLTLLLLSRC